LFIFGKKTEIRHYTDLIFMFMEVMAVVGRKKEGEGGRGEEGRYRRKEEGGLQNEEGERPGRGKGRRMRR
jgi:hypothetical protein